MTMVEIWLDAFLPIWAGVSIGSLVASMFAKTKKQWRIFTGIYTVGLAVLCMIAFAMVGYNMGG
jgi:hypothetical protein